MVQKPNLNIIGLPPRPFERRDLLPGRALCQLRGGGAAEAPARLRGGQDYAYDTEGKDENKQHENI